MGRASSGQAVNAATSVEQLAAAFERGDLRRTRALAEELLARSPEHPEALHFLAATLTELGETEPARHTFDRALAVSPKDPHVLLGAADLLLCHLGDDRESVTAGLALVRRGRRLTEARKDQALWFEFLLLEGVAYNQLGETARAVERLDAALGLQPGSVDAMLEKALALFELCQFSQAEKLLHKLEERAPRQPWVHHALGLLAERRGDRQLAQRHFARAHALGPAEFPLGLDLSEDAFAEVVQRAMARLPAQIAALLDWVPVAIEPLPDLEDLLSCRPPLSPSILGVFRGPALEEQAPSAREPSPATIVLFQRNLERFAGSLTALEEQIAITLLHELGHFIGLSEEELWARGLE